MSKRQRQRKRACRGTKVFHRQFGCGEVLGHSRIDGVVLYRVKFQSGERLVRISTFNT